MKGVQDPFGTGTKGLKKGFAGYFHRVLLQREREEVVEERRRDFKTELQELVQRRSDQVLRYEMVRSSGPDHAKVFEARVTINGQTAGTGTGRSKKEAEQAAARNALDEMKK